MSLVAKVPVDVPVCPLAVAMPFHGLETLAGTGEVPVFLKPVEICIFKRAWNPHG